MKPKQVDSKPENFKLYVKKAKEIISTWPKWKQKTRATSLPRKDWE